VVNALEGIFNSNGRGGIKKAKSYLLKNHITHPATNTPPTNIAKQYNP
jgi:hypothetical protein